MRCDRPAEHRCRLPVTLAMCRGTRCGRLHQADMWTAQSLSAQVQACMAVLLMHSKAGTLNPALHEFTGEARTAAMVADAGGEDAEFATFVEPAGESQQLHPSLPLHCIVRWGAANSQEPLQTCWGCQDCSSDCGSNRPHLSRAAPQGMVPFRYLFSSDPARSTICWHAGLIVQNLIEEYLPESAPERASLLRRAKEMKLPENPLVRHNRLLNCCCDGILQGADLPSTVSSPDLRLPGLVSSTAQQDCSSISCAAPRGLHFGQLCSGRLLQSAENPVMFSHSCIHVAKHRFQRCQHSVHDR